MSPKRVWKVRAWPEELRVRGWPQDGAADGRGVGLGLGGALGRRVQEFLHVVGGLGFQVAQVLIHRGHEPGEGCFQRHGGAGSQHGERLGDRRGGSARACRTGGGQNVSGRCRGYCHAPQLT